MCVYIRMHRHMYIYIYIYIHTYTYIYMHPTCTMRYVRNHTSYIDMWTHIYTHEHTQHANFTYLVTVLRDITETG